MSDLLSLYTTNFGVSYNSFRLIFSLNNFKEDYFFKKKSNYNDVFQNEQSLILNIACLDKNIQKMFEILGELITSNF